eukprot:gene9677-11877_t
MERQMSDVIHAAVAALATKMSGGFSAGVAKFVIPGEGAIMIDPDGVRAGDVWHPLARRPVLFALVRALATAWPGSVDREALIADVFRTRHPDETHRARLRVEIGRLRALIAPLAGVEPTPRGFVLQPHGGRDVAVLAPPVDGEQGALVALLSD